MPRIVRLALGQINPCLGSFSSNIEKMSDFMALASKAGADIVAFPELALTGYPPEDLLLHPQFIEDNLSALQELARIGGEYDFIVVVGFVDRIDDIYNAAAVMHKGRVVHVYHKIHLPNYSVFDEERYFRSGRLCPVYQSEDLIFGVNICEDIWYPDGPSYAQTLNGAELIVNINASPFYSGKSQFREKMLSTRANDSSAVIAYVNICGGQDELVFDGGSMVVDAEGDIIAEAGHFEEDLLITDVDLDRVFVKRLHDPRSRRRVNEDTSKGAETIMIPFSLRKDKTAIETTMRRRHLLPEEEIYRALVTGTRDYVCKNGFSRVCLGLSGGIDSSLVAKIAADALGRENVKALFMPSRFTSIESREDAYELANTIGIEIVEIPIMDIYESYINVLEPFFSGLKTDITEENLQARIRGNLLMAFSNKFGMLVLTTGNKSEMSVGYATLYGDMAGGFAVIKDVAKTMVYRICRWLNASSEGYVIPERVLTKAPTAELRDGQKDTDSLPPYDELDRLIEAYIEQDRGFSAVLELCGNDAAKASKILGMIDRSEYKRRQSPPGVKITQRAFGRDRRYPITNRYSGMRQAGR